MDDLVRVIAFDATGNAHPVSLRVKTTRRATAPYHRWALINLGGEVTDWVSKLNQTQSRILLAVIFTAKPLRLKDLATIVGAPTSQVCREAKALVALGALERVDGLYAPTPTIRWIGRWNDNPSSG